MDRAATTAADLERVAERAYRALCRGQRSAARPGRYGCGAARAAVACFRQRAALPPGRSEEHTSALQSLMRLSYAVFCLSQTPAHTNHLPARQTTTPGATVTFVRSQ